MCEGAIVVRCEEDVTLRMCSFEPEDIDVLLSFQMNPSLGTNVGGSMKASVSPSIAAPASIMQEKVINVLVTNVSNPESNYIFFEIFCRMLLYCNIIMV